MNTTNLLGPMPVDAKAFAEGLNKVVAAGSAYRLGFSGKGLVMRLRMCATDECHEDEWLSAVMNQAADEIERLERENAKLSAEARTADGVKWSEMSEMWRHKFEAAECEIAELRRDKARLDWLADPKNTIGNVSLPLRHVMNNPDSMRAAIDAAMEGDK